MYELLMQWGLETLQKVALGKSESEVAVMLEAIRAKNTIVVERFRYAWTACQAIVDLAVRIEEALPKFLEESPATDGTVASAKRFMGSLRNDFHPTYYRQLIKLRCQFDATNDLLSAYSDVFSSALHFHTVGRLAIEKEFLASSDLIRLYRGLWSFYVRIVSGLVRVSSSDLRFWLTDEPYIVGAREIAGEDWAAARKWLVEPEGGGNPFYLSLEQPSGLEAFWRRIC